MELLGVQILCTSISLSFKCLCVYVWGRGRRGVIADSCYILGKGNELKIFIFRVGGCSFFFLGAGGLVMEYFMAATMYF